MSRNTSQNFDLESSKNQRWAKRELKQRNQMRVHGQGLKKLAEKLNSKKPQSR